VEHRQVEDRPATSRRGSGDDPAQFLRELRQLRDGAGLGQAELAARAHYPYDRIKAAEVGPTLPDLPVLSAYVRGCGGTTEEWEERWRSLTSAPTLPLLDARPAGCSTAASAGARVGSISPVADTPDPSVILAALDRVAEEMAETTPAPIPSMPGVSTIEQRPASPVSAPAAAKSASGKAGTAKVNAWETTTMRTAWSSATGPLARETGEPAVAGTSTTAGGTTTTAGAAAAAAALAAAGEGVRTAAGRPGTAGYSAATLGKPESGGSVGGMGSHGSSGSGRSAATKPVGTARAASTMATAASGPTTVGRRSRGLSRITVAALITIAICALIALLAILA
jgi:Helix-turn-helix domain